MTGIRWTESELNEYLAHYNRSAVSAADVKPNLSNALDAAPQAVQVDKRFRVRVTSSGRRLADTDGNSAKAVLDGITAAGVWRDDSSTFVEEISFTQKVGEEDQTIIEIVEVPDDMFNL